MRKVISHKSTRRLCLIAGAVATAMSAANAAPVVSAATTLTCDSSMQAAFKPDAQTRVLQVKKVKKGDPIPNKTMDQFVYLQAPTTFGADLCWVKLLVGPGNPGPVDAPSTSPGIAIEVWLPEKDVWNHRFHAIGGSGSTGSEEGVLDKVSGWTGGADQRSAPRVAAEEGAVTSSTDSGKGTDRSSSFLMGPDGKPNTWGIEAWKRTALVEQAVKTKALIKAYYGSAPKYSYWDGASGGGTQAYRIAQTLPNEYDGILAGVPALNFVELTANMYPGFVIKGDLGGKPLSNEQLDAVSNAAITACDVVDGKHLGFIIDNASCRYDPTKDRAMLCSSDGGTNSTAACLTRIQARAVNKFWYGPTRDGSVPDPAVDNGWQTPVGDNRLWYGVPRGTNLTSFAQINGMWGADMFALTYGDPKIASTAAVFGIAPFRNALGDGQDAWKGWNYGQFVAGWDRMLTAEGALRISPNDPDLGAFKASGGKMMTDVHVNDVPVLVQGAIGYYEQLASKMGGPAQVDTFFKLYLSPGLGHGSANGTANPMANPPAPGRRQLYNLLVAWVEQGVAPGRVVVTSATQEPSALVPTPKEKLAEISLPLCAYPSRPNYVGGDIHKENSYQCK